MRVKGFAVIVLVGIALKFGGAITRKLNTFGPHNVNEVKEFQEAERKRKIEAEMGVPFVAPPAEKKVSLWQRKFLTTTGSGLGLSYSNDHILSYVMQGLKLPPFLTVAAVGTSFTAGVTLANAHVVISILLGLVALAAAAVSLLRSLGIIGQTPFKKKRAVRRKKSAPEIHPLKPGSTP